MSTPKAVTTLFIAIACLMLPGCHQHSSQAPTERSVQNQSDEEREYEQFREKVERTKKRVAYPGHPGNPDPKAKAEKDATH